MRSAAPKHHHLDRRAADLVEKCPGDPDELLKALYVATWLGVSVDWLDNGRHRGYGPEYIRLSPRRIRYRRSDVIRFLEERRHSSTAEYATTGWTAEEVGHLAPVNATTTPANSELGSPTRRVQA